MVMTQTLTDQQRNVLTLWSQVNASLAAFSKLMSGFGSTEEALAASREQWQQLGLHPAHLKRYDDRIIIEQTVAKVEIALHDDQYRMVFLGDNHYPELLAQIFDPPPLLFYRGNVLRLQEPQIAMVGSRKPTPHAQKITFDMAQYLAQSGYVITSGLAMGVDKQAHLGALTPIDPSCQDPALLGRTIGVMGTGIDVYYPRHHDHLFEQIISQGGCIISELLPSTQANKHTFPRRNRLVAGLSLATIVTEATIQSGSLITARLASEQGKQVFAIPSHIDNANAEGCHHLIREGATLIYHPDQVIEDVQKQRTYRMSSLSTHPQSASFGGSVIATNPSPQLIFANKAHPQVSPTATLTPLNQSPSVQPNRAKVPKHLRLLYECLDWTGQDLDALKQVTEMGTATLLGQLMELELLGLIAQQGGRYLRV